MAYFFPQNCPPFGLLIRVWVPGKRILIKKLMTNEPPKVIETGLYSVSEAAMLLGVSRGKLYDAIKRGARCGGIDGRVRRDNGRFQFTGKEILRYWRG